MSKPVIDMDTMEIVPSSSETVDKSKGQESTEDGSETEEEVSDESEEEKSKEDGSEEEESNEEEGESEEEKPKEEGPEEEDEEVEESTSDEDTDKIIAERFGEKYGIESQAELEETIDKAVELMDRVESLEKENKTLKETSGKPKFKSKAQEKFVEFAEKTGYDPAKAGDAAMSYSKLITMDIENTDAKLLLEEKFVLERPELTREEALHLFKKKAAKLYDPKREDFEDDADFDEAVKDANIQKKSDAAQAKKWLKKQQDEFKVIEDISDGPKVDEAVLKSIETNEKEYDKFISSTNELILEEEDGSSYKYAFNKDQLKNIKAVMSSWVKNPSSYDEKGNLNSEGPEQMFKRVAASLYFDEILNALSSQMKNQVNIQRVEKIAKVQPKKTKVPGGTEKLPEPDIYTQASNLAKKRKGRG